MSDTAAAFLGRPATQADAKFWVIPAPIELDGTIQKGQAAAPEAILAASLHLQPYDEEVANAPADEAPVATLPLPASVSLESIADQAKAALEAEAVPVLLGGEPLAALAGIRAVAATSEEFTVLHFSARAGLTKGGVGLSSSSFVNEIVAIENCKRIIQVGVRSLSAEESAVIFADQSKVETFFACDIAKQADDAWQEDVVNELSTPVYVSIDLSAFDRASIPSVGTPEPGGIDWWTLLTLLKKVTSRRRIAGFDVTDLVPVEGDVTGDYTAARLIHKMMAYMVAAGKMF